MKPGPVRCPRRLGWLYIDFDRDIGFRDVTCGSNSCPYCILTNAWLWSLAVGHVRPSRYAVFTLVPGEWAALRKDIARLFQVLDRKGYPLHAVYSCEVNPNGTGHHLNVWWWGPDVPFEVLRDAAVALGWGARVSVERFSVDRGGAGYGVKEALGYGMKEAVRDPEVAADQAELSGGQRAFLDRNGGALMHARKNFWRDGVGGVPLSGRRETLRVQRAARDASRLAEGHDRQATPWALVRGSEVVAHSAGPLVSAIPTGVTGQSMNAASLLPVSLPVIAPSTMQPPLPGFSWELATITSSASGRTRVSSAIQSRQSRRKPFRPRSRGSALKT